MVKESGNVSINTENIFPIIKQWLYSEKDIFIRELVSNACDAIAKHKRLVAIGEAPAPVSASETASLAESDSASGASSALASGAEFSGSEQETGAIAVLIEKKAKKLSFIDTGIGMTADEVKNYINQIAFSGAQDFLTKYKDKLGEDEQIIGHFGLGFYSSFMVADNVTIDTLSWQPGAEAVHWGSVTGMDYEIGASERKTRGTTVTLTMSDDCAEYLDAWKMREVLRKYCSFMPYPIIVTDADREAEDAAKKAEEAAKEQEKDKDKDKDKDKETPSSDSADETEPKLTKIHFRGTDYEPVNNTAPLWLKAPKDCTDEEYKEFYKQVFLDFDDPLFWIHLNLDYPFNLKGILYFPKLRHEFETMEGQIKLYYNQVFVADNIKEVIPEFLLLLKGCLDCPDLPLNVSRSFLQNDSYVKKISAHITKKVGDKLSSLYENAREDYEKYWDDISPFIKYGCIKEDNFYERVKDIIIYKNLDDKFITLKEYLEAAKEKHENTVFYVTDEKQQAQYVKMFRENGMDAVVLKSMLDSHFIQFLESKDRSVKIQRIDSDISDSLKAADGGELSKEEKEEMEKALGAAFGRASGNEKLNIRYEALKAKSVPAMLLLSEYSRRTRDMSRMYGGSGGMGGMDMASMFPKEETLILNTGNGLLRKVAKLELSGGRQEEVDLVCRHIYDMALLGNKQLEPAQMTDFLDRSGQLLERMMD